MNTKTIITTLLALGALTCAGAARAGGPINQLLLNELTVQGTEIIEVHNIGALPFNTAGFRFYAGTDTIPVPAVILAPGSYFLFPTGGDIISDVGEEIGLVDATEETADRCFFGQAGGAPLPPAGAGLADGGVVTLARAPDASTYATPPPTDPVLSGDLWTLDLTPTLGAMNDAPTAALRSSLLLNEVDPKPAGGGDAIELHNPSGAAIDVDGWFICNGDDIQFLSPALVPPGGFLAVTTDAGFDIEENDLIYVFDADSVRVDQLGFDVLALAPPLEFCQCFGRFPDGAGPHVCWDYPSCGGGDTLRPLVCTMGAPNENETECGPTAVEHTRWGTMKQRFTQPR